jgi:iron-sulfur cluster assembly accessory protein
MPRALCLQPAHEIDGRCTAELYFTTEIHLKTASADSIRVGGWNGGTANAAPGRSRDGNGKNRATAAAVLRQPFTLTAGESMETQQAISMISVTSTAVAEVRRYMDENGATEDAGLRVGVLPGGCSGFQYGLNIEDAPNEDDIVLDVNGLRLFLDPFSLQYLSGVEIDYVTTFQGSGFTFNNPNASGGCGCGSSFTV